MSSANARVVSGSRRVWIVALGACTLWLVIQNAILAVAVLAIEPATLLRVLAALAKTTLLLVERFWGTPAAMALLAAALGGLALRTESRRPAEARHG